MAETHINDLYDSIFSPSFFERKAGAAGVSHDMPSNRLRKIVEIRNDHDYSRSNYLLWIWNERHSSVWSRHNLRNANDEITLLEFVN